MRSRSARWTHEPEFALMAPERLRGLPADERAQVYEIGAVLHLMLTGTRVLQRERDLPTIEAVLRDEVPAPSTLRPGISEAMERIIMRAMAKDPSHRFGSLAELGAALAEVAGADPEALRRSVRERLSRAAKPARLAPFFS